MTDHETPDLAAFKEMIVNFGHVCAVHGEPDADLKAGHYILREVERLNRAARAPLLAEIERIRAERDAAMQPLSFDRLQSVMAQHFGGRDLTDDEADSAEAFARAVERAHGIGA